MKTMINKVMTLAVALLTAVSASAWKKVVADPDFTTRLYGSIHVDSVVMTDKATVLHCTLAMYSKGVDGWRSIDTPFYLNANGKRYVWTSYEGFEPGKRYTYDDCPDGLRHSITFPPIPRNTETIDLYGKEGDNESWSVFGINLKGKKLKKQDLVPEAVRNQAPTTDSRQSIIDNRKPTIDNRESKLSIPSFRQGSATLSGRYYGYRKEMGSTIKVTAELLLGQKPFAETIRLNDDGTFSVEVPMTTTHTTVSVESFFFQGSMVLTNGEESTMHIDMQKRGHMRPNSLRKAVENVWETEQYVWMTGANADINSLLFPKKKWADIEKLDLTPRQREYFDVMSIARKLEHILGSRYWGDEYTPPVQLVDAKEADDHRLLYFPERLKKALGEAGWSVRATNWAKLPSGLLLDLNKSEFYGRLIAANQPLNEVDLRDISTLSDPFIPQFFAEKNERLRSDLAQDVKAEGCHLRQVTFADDDILGAICRDLDGKNIIFMSIMPGRDIGLFTEADISKCAVELEQKGFALVYIPFLVAMRNMEWHNYARQLAGYHYPLTPKQAETLFRQIFNNNMRFPDIAVMMAGDSQPTPIKDQKTRMRIPQYLRETYLK